jgi:hypothetical protein
MRYIFPIATLFLGIAAANAQTTSQTGANSQATTTQNVVTTRNSGADPLSVPTSPLPTESAPASPGSSSTASTNGTSTASGPADGSTSGISASPSNTSQQPLLLPGETPNKSAQAPLTTATTLAGHSSNICAPPVPSTDGGSAHLTEMAGISLDGC